MGYLQVDRMLNEDLLVGPGRQARDTLRPLAYSTLADLVHHVKDRIDLDQVSRVIQVGWLLLYRWSARTCFCYRFKFRCAGCFSLFYRCCFFGRALLVEASDENAGW